MNATNVEIKARCHNPGTIRQILEGRNARFIGEDRQIDTYYQVPRGRMKLRQGKIENALIYYDRHNQQGPKTSQIKLFKTSRGEDLRDLLSIALDELIVVDKKREIYFVDNVKFHIDQVQKLGSFVEIEAIDEDGSRSLEELQHQCASFMKLFEIQDQDLIAESYSDLMLAQHHITL